MKTLLLILLMCFVFTFASAQSVEKTTGERTFKGYINFRYDQSRILEDNVSYFSVITENGFSFGKISIALEKSINDRWTNEFEFSPLYINYRKYKKDNYYSTSTTPYTDYTSMVTLDVFLITRYQINYYLRSSEKKWRFIIGAATGIRYGCTITRPLYYTTYPKCATSFIVPIEIIPGFNVKLTDRLGFALNIPFEINNLTLETLKTDNPSLPVKLQHTTNFYGVFIPKSFNLRFGLSYNF